MAEDREPRGGGPRSVAGVAADGAPRGSTATETFRTDRARSSGTGGGEDKDGP